MGLLLGGHFSGGAAVCSFGSLAAVNLSDTGSGPGDDGFVWFELNSSGVERTQTNGNSIVTRDTWIGSCLNSQYEAMLSVVSGDAPDGASSAIDTYLGLATSRSWELQSENPDSDFGVWRIRIRRISDNFVGIDEEFDADANSGPPE